MGLGGAFTPDRGEAGAAMAVMAAASFYKPMKIKIRLSIFVTHAASKQIRGAMVEAVIARVKVETIFLYVFLAAL